MTFQTEIPNPQSPRPSIRSVPSCLRASVPPCLHSPSSLRRFVAPSLSASSPSAFSIVEILFAIMILGIGFIMVAAIFPVAIQQGRDAIDQTTGQTIARDAAFRAAAGFRCITDPTNLGTLATSSAAAYQPIDVTNAWSPTLTPVTFTKGATDYSVGGGAFSLCQLAGTDWQYLGENQYLSQMFFHTTYNAATTAGTLNILSLAMRDGRDDGDKSTPLGGTAPSGRFYVKACEVAVVGMANVYSDLYVRTADGWTEDQIRAFLGTTGTIVRTALSTSDDHRIVRMVDSAASLKFDTPPATGWVTAYMFSSDVPVIGTYTLTTSLP